MTLSSEPVTQAFAQNPGKARTDGAWDGRPSPRGIVVAGVELLPSAVAELALRLARAGEFALSIHIGRAVDQTRDHIVVDTRDHTALLTAIGDEPPPNLVRLHAALLDDS